MIRCPDNQINTSFIDISRIKWLVFLLWSSFFRTTSTVASSEAPADYQPGARSNRRHSGEASKTMDYKSVFTNLCLEQVVDKGIRQKSIHSFHSIHSFPDGSAFCPGAPKRVYTSSDVCHSHEWRVDTASGNCPTCGQKKNAKGLKKKTHCAHARWSISW